MLPKRFAVGSTHRIGRWGNDDDEVDSMSARLLRGTLTLLLSVGACAAASASERSSVATQWNQALLDAISETGSGPTISSRALAVAHTCMFDAWAAYDGHARGTQFGLGLRRPKAERTQANKRAAVSHAAYRAAVDLFPTQKARFTALLKRQGYVPSPFEAGLVVPAGIANIACGEVLAVRHDDGSNQLGDRGGVPYSDYTGYRSYNTVDTLRDPSRWQPLRVVTADGGSVVQTFTTPQWGRVKPFALQDFRSYNLQPPARYGTPEYAQQARQLVDYSAHLNDTTKAIAEYWANGPHSVTPPGQWNLFAEYVAARDHMDLDHQVEMYFAMNNALMDAGIFSWLSKRKLDYVRPITAVHTVFEAQNIRAWGGLGMGTRTIPGTQWMPYQPPTVVTPPFPECVSGHSTFSAAAAQVLRNFTGSDALGASVVVPAGSSLVEPGLVPARDVTLKWPTFSAAADEAGMSRRYGGIHFPTGDMEGRRVGRMIGQQAWLKSRSYFAGTR